MKKLRLQRFFLAWLLVLFSFAAFAQSRKITGTVTDENGASLDGATIVVKNTKIRTTTNENGIFSINVPNDKHVLVITYVGLRTQEININGKNVIKIVLKPSSGDLNDVVV
ncbi:MAG: carboxypeptidase-like regulatory domain-containing protein, partial [Hydrotalea flava]|nr:carboxypeptidase-like regulatory domain-containing protein [Hydrotalea flava]